MIKGLATQEELGAFKNQLELLGSNLSFHVNSSLSKAHGIALLRGPANDGEGNDLRIYQDEFGHAVSGTDVTKANFIRFIVNGVPYYAPCIYSDPGAQPATTGAIQLSESATDGPGGVSLITDYISFEEQAAANVNALFLQHPGKTHQVAHIPMVVVAQNTFAPDGHLYATHRVRFQWHNHVYEIPVHTRLGGPAQPMRGMNLLTDVAKKFNAISVGHDDTQKATFYLTNPTAGTLPFTLTYQINEAVPIWTKKSGLIQEKVQAASSVWNDMTDTSPGYHVADTAEEVSYDISVSNQLKIRTQNGSDSSKAQCLLRVKMVNSYGTAYSNWAFMRSNDEDGSWIFSGPDSNSKPYYVNIIGSPAIV